MDTCQSLFQVMLVVDIYCEQFPSKYCYSIGVRCVLIDRDNEHVILKLCVLLISTTILLELQQ